MEIKVVYRHVIFFLPLAMNSKIQFIKVVNIN
jgi:hypothetical protein